MCVSSDAVTSSVESGEKHRPRIGIAWPIHITSPISDWNITLLKLHNVSTISSDTTRSCSTLYTSISRTNLVNATTYQNDLFEIREKQHFKKTLKHRCRHNNDNKHNNTGRQLNKIALTFQRVYQFFGNNFKYVDNAIDGTTSNVFTVRALYTRFTNTS